MEKKGTPIAIQPAGKKEGRNSFAAPRCNGTALFGFQPTAFLPCVWFSTPA